MTEKFVEVQFVVSDDESEPLRCTPLPDGHFVIESIPTMACGISVGDTISATRGPRGVLVADELVAKSGHCTFTAHPDPDQLAPLLERIRSLGGRYSGETGVDPAVAIDVPSVDAFVLLGGWLDETEVEYEVADPVPEEASGDDGDDESGEDEA